MAIEQMDTSWLLRFAIRDMGKTVAAGVCLKIEEVSSLTKRLMRGVVEWLL